MKNRRNNFHSPRINCQRGIRTTYSRNDLEIPARFVENLLNQRATNDEGESERSRGRENEKENK